MKRAFRIIIDRKITMWTTAVYPQVTAKNLKEAQQKVLDFENGNSSEQYEPDIQYLYDSEEFLTHEQNYAIAMTNTLLEHHVKDNHVFENSKVVNFVKEECKEIIIDENQPKINDIVIAYNYSKPKAMIGKLDNIYNIGIYKYSVGGQNYINAVKFTNMEDYVKFLFNPKLCHRMKYGNNVNSNW